MDESSSFVEYSNATPGDRNRAASVLTKEQNNTSSLKQSLEEIQKSKSQLNSSIGQNEVIDDL